MGDNTSGGTFIELTASIVSAYVSNNSVPTADLPALIGQVHAALTRVSSGHGDAPSEPPKPAVSLKKSITPDYIVCLEDGKKFKSLKRHLRTQYNMTPEQYREKWGLAPDYPMVAPNYAAVRSREFHNWKAPGRLSPGPSSLFRSLGGGRLRPPEDDRQMPSQVPWPTKKSRDWGKRGRWLLRHRRQRRLRVRSNALDHGAKPVRSLRGQVLAQAQPLKHRDRVRR